MMMVWMAEYDMNTPIHEVIAQFQMSADQRRRFFRSCWRAINR